MNKLEQLYLFMKFVYAPWGAAKGEVWESCFYDAQMDEVEITKIALGLLSGDVIFDDFTVKLLRIVADPGLPKDKQWAEQIAACASTDIEAAHADADRLLVNLVNELGYKESAAAWQAIDKWYV